MKYVVAFSFLLVGLVRGQSVDSLRQQLQTARHDTTRLRLYTDLIYLYDKKVQADSSYHYLQKLYPLATGLRSGVYIGRYYYYLGRYYRRKKLMDKSLQSMQTALRFFRNTKDSKDEDVNKTLYGLTMMYSDKGDTEQAIAQSLSNLRYFEQRHNVEMMLSTYAILLDIYSRLNNKRLSQYYIDQYFHLVSQAQSGKLKYQYLGYAMKAYFYEQQDDYSRAWPYRKLASQTARNISISDLITAITEAAANLRHRRQYQAAITYLQEGLRVGKQVSEAATLDIIWRELAQNEAGLGHYQAALTAARQSVAVVRSKGGWANSLAEAVGNLATIQEAAGQYRQALQSYKESQTLRDNLYSKETNQKVAELQMQYDVAKKENTILALNKNAHLQRQQLLIANQQRFLFGLGTLALLSVTAITVYFLYQINRRNKQIQLRSQELQEALQLRDKLFSILTHDLRSPVAGLHYSLQLIQRDFPQAKGLKDLERRVSSVYSTLDNLLYWAQGQQNGLRPRLVRFNLLEVVEEVIDGFVGMLVEKRLQIVIPQTQTLPEDIVLADEKMTQISLRNIIHNAVKFSPMDGLITIALDQIAHRINLTIRDEGEGIKEFHTNQSQADRPKSKQGTGLGLVVSEELMQQNGGNLSVFSQKGQGTIVTMTFQVG